MMVTLITVGNSEGDRRCDARCYDARYDTCECCCGGVNHGAGRKQATQNTTDIANKVLKSTLDKGAVIQPIQKVLGGLLE